jgi:pimeloyl-ACP methyl ester carboxylesterase
LIGYTDGPPWSADRPLTLDEEAAWIERWIDGAGAPVHLVGHSYGGAVALKVAQRRPERVRSLILYEPVLFRLLTGDPLTDIVALAGEVERAGRRRPGNRRAYLHRLLVGARQLAAHVGGTAGGSDPAHAQGRRRVPRRVRGRHAGFGLRAAADADPPRLDLAPAARIARVVQSFMPTASRIEMPGLGHAGPITHPDAVNALIALFLDSLHRDSGVQRQAELAQAA